MYLYPGINDHLLMWLLDPLMTSLLVSYEAIVFLS